MPIEILNSVDDLRNQLEQARSSLKSTDENIKRLIGRDPSELPLRNVALKRPLEDKVSSRSQSKIVRRNELSNNYDSKRNKSEYETNDIQKRRNPNSVFSRLSDKPVVEHNRPTKGLISKVIVTPKEVPSRQKALDEQNKDVKFKERNKRMFGALLGTLQKFQQEETKQKKKGEKKAQIEKKIEEHEIKEKEEIRKERQELFYNRRKKQTEIKILELKMLRMREYNAWEEKQRPRVNFIVTKSKPHIHFLPKRMDDKSKELLEKSAIDIEKAIEKKREEVSEELKKIEERMLKSFEQKFGFRNRENEDNHLQNLEQDLDIDQHLDIDAIMHSPKTDRPEDTGTVKSEVRKVEITDSDSRRVKSEINKISKEKTIEEEILDTNSLSQSKKDTVSEKTPDTLKLVENEVVNSKSLLKPSEIQSRKSKEQNKSDSSKNDLGKECDDLKSVSPNKPSMISSEHEKTVEKQSEGSINKNMEKKSQNLSSENKKGKETILSRSKSPSRPKDKQKNKDENNKKIEKDSKNKKSSERQSKEGKNASNKTRSKSNSKSSEKLTKNKRKSRSISKTSGNERKAKENIKKPRTRSTSSSSSSSSSERESRKSKENTKKKNKSRSKSPTVKSDKTKPTKDEKEKNRKHSSSSSSESSSSDSDISPERVAKKDKASKKKSLKRQSRKDMDKQKRKSLKHSSSSDSDTDISRSSKSSRSSSESSDSSSERNSKKDERKESDTVNSDKNIPDHKSDSSPDRNNDKGKCLTEEHEPKGILQEESKQVEDTDIYSDLHDTDEQNVQENDEKVENVSGNNSQNEILQQEQDEISDQVNYHKEPDQHIYQNSSYENELPGEYHRNTNTTNQVYQGEPSNDFQNNSDYQSNSNQGPYLPQTQYQANPDVSATYPNNISFQPPIMTAPPMQAPPHFPNPNIGMPPFPGSINQQFPNNPNVQSQNNYQNSPNVGAHFPPNTQNDFLNTPQNFNIPPPNFGAPQNIAMPPQNIPVPVSFPNESMSYQNNPAYSNINQSYGNQKYTGELSEPSFPPVQRSFQNAPPIRMQFRHMTPQKPLYHNTQNLVSLTQAQGKQPFVPRGRGRGNMFSRDGST